MDDNNTLIDAGLDLDNISVNDIRDDTREAILLHYGYNPDNVRLLNSGAVLDNNTKRFVGRIPGTSAINSNNVYEYHEKRRRLRIDSVRQGLASVTGKGSLRESMAIVGAALAEEAIDGKGIARVKAIERIYDYLELSPVATQGGVKQGVSIGADSIEALRDIILAIRDIKSDSASGV